MKSILSTCIFVASYVSTAQNVGDFYGSTDGTKSVDLKLGKNGSSSFKIFTEDDGGSTYWQIHGRRWGAGYTWTRESSGGADKKIAYLYGGSTGQYYKLFHNDQSTKVQFHSNGTSYINGGNVGIGTSSPTQSMHISDGSASNVTGTGSKGSLLLTDQSRPRIWFEDSGEGAGDKLMALTYDIENLYVGSMSDGGGAWDNKDILVINRDGNVGIGESNPASPLHVKSSTNRTLKLDFTNISDGSYTWQSLETNSTEQWRIVGREADEANLEFWNKNSNSVMSLNQNGKVGIGNTNPNSLFEIGSAGSALQADKLAVRGDKVQGFTSFGNLYSLHDYDIAAFGSRESGHQVSAIKLLTMNSGGSTRGARIAFLNTDVSGVNSETLKFMVGSSAGTDVMNLLANGNVGIGTATPQAKLAVNGHVRATEIKVLADITVPDYVFEPDYDLRTLKETKEYITENKHLPEIPSAAEIGENGIDLGDMNMRLLKKIEELTLYQIELMERLEKAEKKITELEKAKE